MTEALPEPLVPADVDLRGLEYMPLFGNHLFGSDFNSKCSDIEWRAGVTLWWASWNQVPAASLPDDDESLCRLADFGRDIKTWRKVRANALRGFTKCSDGRLYHRFLAPQALIAWERRVESMEGRKGESERKKRERERRAEMFKSLSAVGITPAWNVTTSELRSLCAQHVTQPVTEDTPPVTPPVTEDVTAKKRSEVKGSDGNINSTSKSVL